jgi:hypothetical protein
MVKRMSKPVRPNQTIESALAAAKRMARLGAKLRMIKLMPSIQEHHGK